MGFPLEVITMLGSALFSGVMSLWAMKLKAQAAERASLIAAANAQADITQAAREHGLRDGRFAFTRQIIALTAVFFIIAFPKLYTPIMLWLELDYQGLVYGWTEFHPPFFPWNEGKEVMEWKHVVGMAVTPLDTHLLSSITGFYFGNQIVRR